jgi:Zn-dependent metalloprotease
LNLKFIKRVIIFLNVLIINAFSYGQLDQFTTILSPYFSKPEVSGFMFFQTPNNLPAGQCFQYYKSSAGDVNNDMVLEKDWIDPQLNMHHYKYIQTYKDIKLEGVGCIEHFDSQGSLVFTNAKHAVNLTQNATPVLSEEQAFKILVNHLSNNNLSPAWDDFYWELDVKVEQEDSNATLKPTGELIFAVDALSSFTFNVDGSRYTLAYKFDVVTINPYDNKSYYIDANTGQVIKVTSNIFNDGPATVHNAPLLQTTQTIDTRHRGFPNNDWVLETDNGNKHVHTKYHNNNLSWIILSEIADNDDNWINNNDSYLVDGIGKIDAGLITYWNVRNVLMSSSQYLDAREGSIVTSILLFGECSLQHFSTENAWFAVGVGSQSSCTEILNVNTNKETDLSIYPNPFEEYFLIQMNKTEKFNLNLYNISGKLVYSSKINNNSTKISLSDLTQGVYVVELINENQTIRKKIIKQ